MNLFFFIKIIKWIPRRIFYFDDFSIDFYPTKKIYCKLEAMSASFALNHRFKWHVVLAIHVVICDLLYGRYKLCGRHSWTAQGSWLARAWSPPADAQRNISAMQTNGTRSAC